MYYLNIPNKSHYITDNSAQSFRVLNPDTFTAKNLKQLGYYVRSYYEWQYIQSIGGHVFFYTLTYNDNALPKFNGISCFNHNDLRMFMRSSGFDKLLLRNYGYKVKYLITCELGDGKGSRGFANNPHYHVLFYLYPINRFPLNSCDNKSYEILTPVKFMHIVRKYWCGDDYLIRTPQSYKFGIAMPGDNYGLVNSASALRYVVKYCTKDKNAIDLYNKLKESCLEKIWNFIYTDDRFIVKFKNYCYINQLDPKQKKSYLESVVNWAFDHFFKRKIRNNHVPKVKISQGVGLYGLNHVNDSGLSVTIPQSTSKIVSCALPLYYYRKMYYNIVKDDKGNNKYVLNEKGIDIKLRNIDSLINKKYNEYESLFKAFDVDYTPQILSDYCLYDLVYRNRTCRDFDVDIDLYNDYKDFLTSDYYKSPYLDDTSAYFKLLDNRINYPYYNYHPYFAPLVKTFEKFDEFLENYYIWQDNEKERNFIERDKVRKEHAINKFIRKLYS